MTKARADSTDTARCRGRTRLEDASPPARERTGRPPLKLGSSGLGCPVWCPRASAPQSARSFSEEGTRLIKRMGVRPKESPPRALRLTRPSTCDHLMATKIFRVDSMVSHDPLKVRGITNACGAANSTLLPSSSIRASRPDRSTQSSS